MRENGPVDLLRQAAATKQTGTKTGNQKGRKLAGAEGLEPTALGFGDRCSTN